MPELYPLIEPYDQGMLDVGQGNRIYWDVSGNPDGKPAVVLHGGPGQGCTPSMRRGFDPERYWIVLFDQRGCGRSTPHAGDPATDMRHNTTAHLVSDMERLRDHLGISKWLLRGGSWGCTLALAYAREHPERVSEIVLSSISTSRRSEIDWLYRGVAPMFPAEWQAFRQGAGDPDVVTAYARLMESPDQAVRVKAAQDWYAWEEAVLSLEPGAKPAFFEVTEETLAFVRICAHYFANGAWLDEGVLIRDAARLADIPGVIIHGRQDLSCPFQTAWELAQAWPGAELHGLPDSGHRGSDTRRSLIVETLDRFATEPPRPSAPRVR